MSNAKKLPTYIIKNITKTGQSSYVIHVSPIYPVPRSNTDSFCIVAPDERTYRFEDSAGVLTNSGVAFIGDKFSCHKKLDSIQHIDDVNFYSVTPSDKLHRGDIIPKPNQYFVFKFHKKPTVYPHFILLEDRYHNEVILHGNIYYTGDDSNMVLHFSSAELKFNSVKVKLSECFTCKVINLTKLSTNKTIAIYANFTDIRVIKNIGSSL